MKKCKSKLEYQKELFNLLSSWTLNAQCKKCGYPTIVGYCCSYCGDDDPTSTVRDALI